MAAGVKLVAHGYTDTRGVPCRRSELLKFSVLVCTAELCLLVLQAFCIVVTFCYFVIFSHFTNLLLLGKVVFLKNYYLFCLVEKKDYFPEE